MNYTDAAQCALQLLADSGLTKGKLVVLTGHDDDKHEVLSILSSLIHAKPVNVNIVLADALIDAEHRGDVSSIIASCSPDEPALLLDRIQILMLPQLQVNAVDLLCRVARRRPVCASWPGRLEGGRLKYAHPDHPEYLDEDASRVTVIDLSTNKGLER